jgi:hypothetical protein
MFKTNKERYNKIKELKSNYNYYVNMIENYDQQKQAFKYNDRIEKEVEDIKKDIIKDSKYKIVCLKGIYQYDVNVIPKRCKDDIQLYVLSYHLYNNAIMTDNDMIKEGFKTVRDKENKVIKKYL